MSYHRIPLTQGKHSLVDLEDYLKLMRYNWVYHKSPRDSYGYALGTTPPYRGKRLHRVILAAKKGQIVDHINHNGIDNRKENIHIVTASENNINRRVSNKYGEQGVGKTRNRKGVPTYWTARITYLGERIYLGTFKTKKEASLMYKEARYFFYDY